MDYTYWRREREEGEADETKRKEKDGERKEKIILIVYVLNLLHSLIGTVLCAAHNTTRYSWTRLSFCVINWTNRLNRTSWKPKERERVEKGI